MRMQGPSGKEPQWIGALYREAFSGSDKAIRKDAEALLPALGGDQGDGRLGQARRNRCHAGGRGRSGA